VVNDRPCCGELNLDQHVQDKKREKPPGARASFLHSSHFPSSVGWGEGKSANNGFILLQNINNMSVTQSVTLDLSLGPFGSHLVSLWVKRRTLFYVNEN
jgi:hypothetical protein